MFLNNLLTMKTILWFAVLIAVASAIDDYHVTFGIYTVRLFNIFCK